MTNNVTIVKAEDFKFARGFKMPDDQNLEDGSNDWIKWGKDNLFPNFLNHIFYSSAYQSGLIRGKVHYLCGSGWTPKTGTQEQIDELFGQYNAQDVLEMLFKDYELYNGFALRVLRSVEGQETFEHIDFDMLRADKDGRGWWYSDDWSKGKQGEDTGIKLIPNHDPRTPQFESVYVYIDKPKNKSIKTSSKQAHNIYPEPIYAGCLKSLMTDVEIQSFHLYNIINGMKVAGVLNFANGEPIEKSKFESAIQDALTPTENSGGILINYSDGDERKPSWIPLSNEDLDKRYLTLETSVVQNIMTGHGATSPMLFGIKTASQLGGTTELNDAFEIFKRTYIRARQTTLESHLNYLLKTVSIQLNEPEPLVKVETTPQAQPAPQPIEQKMNFEQEIEDKILLSLLKCGRKMSKFRVLSESVVTECSEDFNFDFDSTEKALIGSFDESKLEVVYSYDKRPDIQGDSVMETTRDFCRALVESGLVFTRDEINTISERVERNVWMFRGGWYADPNKERPTPFCRHIWKQILVAVSPDVVSEVPENYNIDDVKKITIPNILKDLNLENDNLKFTYGKIKGNTGGEVSFIERDDKWVMGGKVKIDASKYAGNPEKLAAIIRHELRHIYQSKEMGFFIKDGYFYWQNKKFISTKDYNNIWNKINKAKNKEEFDKVIGAYKELPWEADADNYMAKMIFSKEINYIDSVEDNGLVDLIELPKELQENE